MSREVGMLPVVGELSATVIAPAFGNAIFAAFGVRLLYLPIRPAAVPETLGHA
jgi:CO/xanthine dehydrogenase Mo-binding subunit